MTRFNLSQFPEDPFKKQLDNLVFFRNKLSHGDYTIPVDQNKIDEMSSIVMDAMYALTERILEGYNSRSYLKISIVEVTNSSTDVPLDVYEA